MPRLWVTVQSAEIFCSDRLAMAVAAVGWGVVVGVKCVSGGRVVCGVVGGVPGGGAGRGWVVEGLEVWWGVSEITY